MLAVALRNIFALDSVPRGFFQDEAAIGYDGWAISHYGTDEHGAHLPLFFESFEDYKNPIYIYSVAAVTRFLPLTVATTRLPAAVFGTLTVLFLAATALKMTGSYTVTALTFFIAAMTPWLMLESRVAFEVISLVLAISAALYFLAAAQTSRPRLHYLLAGVSLMLGTFTYTPGRLQIAVFAVVLCASYGLPLRKLSSWWLALIPVVLGYVVLVVWGAGHPGALTGRFERIGILNDANPLVALGHFIVLYLTYIPSPEFLLAWGDFNWRHNIHFGGMLLVVAVPLLVIGALACARRFSEPFPRFVLLGFFASPVSAALTSQGTPHALRAAPMFPFCVALIICGVQALLAANRNVQQKKRIAVWGSVALLLNGIGANIWLFTAYPALAADSFQDGAITALEVGHRIAGQHTMYITESTGIHYSFPLFAFQPPPPSTANAKNVTDLLASVHVVRLDPGTSAPLQPGDVLVASPKDPAPQPATIIFSNDWLRVYQVS
jgi:4-amino-4-deoxy-L-arabinose transferase-like glycosyltransferase